MSLKSPTGSNSLTCNDLCWDPPSVQCADVKAASGVREKCARFPCFTTFTEGGLRHLARRLTHASPLWMYHGMLARQQFTTRGTDNLTGIIPPTSGSELFPQIPWN